MIYYIIGIRRSGIHAIANWLFPMMGEFIYLNNYELGKLTDIEMVVKGKFNVLIGIESKDIDEVMKYCNNGKKIFLFRRPTDIIASQEKWYGDRLANEDVEFKLVETTNLFDQYANHITTNKEDTVIFYELWNESLGYRMKIAKDLGLEFNDTNKENVFGYGVSSYDKTIAL